MVVFPWLDRGIPLHIYCISLTEYFSESLSQVLWERIFSCKTNVCDTIHHVLALFTVVTLLCEEAENLILCYDCNALTNKSSKIDAKRQCKTGSLERRKTIMFGVLPDDHHGGIDLKDNLPKENEKSWAEETSLFEGNTSQTVRNNFFIDASSLLDESEVKDVQNNKCSDTNAPPPPLIRRKTFELEADDDKVAALRQEYERRQGNALFQACGVEAPSSLPVGLPHLTDNDVHTPDSLNNDGFDEASDIRPDSAPCDDDPNRNEIVSPAPSPVENYVAIHKDSIDAGSLLEDDSTDSGEKVSNKIDCIPIVSGGIAPEKVQSPMFSRRRTECAPILSGAAPPPEPLSPRSSIEEKPRNPSASSAWVVDISDIVSSPETRRRKDGRSLSSSLGYFVDLEGSGSAVMQRSAGHCDAPRKNVFFSSADKGSMESCMEKAASQESSLGIKARDPKVVHSPEQKMFTMFIGLDNEESAKGIKDRPEPASRRKNVVEKARKQPVYMYIGSESPSTTRKTLDVEQPSTKKQHVRAKSLSTSAATLYPSQATSIPQLHTSVGSFVRLSDLDKAPSRLSDSDKTPSSPRGVDTTSFTLENKRRSWKPKSNAPNCSEALARVIPAVRELSSTAFAGTEGTLFCNLIFVQSNSKVPNSFIVDLQRSGTFALDCTMSLKTITVQQSVAVRGNKLHRALLSRTMYFFPLKELTKD